VSEERPTVGYLFVVVVALLVGFSVLLLLFQVVFSNIFSPLQGASDRVLANATGPFNASMQLASGFSSWAVTVLTAAIPLALLLFLLVVREALDVEWR